MNNQWKVTAYRGKNAQINAGATWVRADSEASARELGKLALRTVGIRGRFTVDARPYDPTRDLAFLGYIKIAPASA